MCRCFVRGRLDSRGCCVLPSQRAAPGSPSHLERSQGITGTRKRLDDALDDAVPCAMTPKRLRGAEDMFASMRIDN
jgi:hypothetical protein